MEVIAKRIADAFPDNKIIINLEGLMIDIKIIKEEPNTPFATGLSTGDYKAPSDWNTISSCDSMNEYKEFKIDDYIY